MYLCGFLSFFVSFVILVVWLNNTKKEQFQWKDTIRWKLKKFIPHPRCLRLIQVEVFWPLPENTITIEVCNELKCLFSLTKIFLLRSPGEGKVSRFPSTGSINSKSPRYLIMCSAITCYVKIMDWKKCLLESSDICLPAAQRYSDSLWKVLEGNQTSERHILQLHPR